MFYLARLSKVNVFFSLFGDTIQLFDSDGLLCRNSVLVFSWTHQLFLFWFVCVCRICMFVLSAFRLGPFGTNLYLLIDGCVAYLL